MTKQLDPEHINISINQNRHMNNQIKMATVSPNWKKSNVYQQNGHVESMVDSHHMITDKPLKRLQEKEPENIYNIICL